MTKLILSTEQQEAKEKFFSWFNEKEKSSQIFKIFGYAGTGKTTIIQHLMKEIKGRKYFATFTGKAALVLNKKGLNATTIHSLIYRPVIDPKTKEVTFVLNEESTLTDATLLTIDECSMINEELGKDILSFGVPVLLLGDPGQLPPIKSRGFFTIDNPDVLLTKIHRQAEGNPIIKLSIRARSGYSIPYFENGEVRCISRNKFKAFNLLDFDQILTGSNKQRMKYNEICREKLKRTSIYPEINDKIICLKNDKKQNIFNGMLAEVLDIHEEDLLTITYTIKTELNETKRLKILRTYFDAYTQPQNLSWMAKLAGAEFDFGYAITVHKAQGSQWNNVLLLDDGFGDWKPTLRKQWLYTAVTRAAEALTIVC